MKNFTIKSTPFWCLFCNSVVSPYCVRYKQDLRMGYVHFLPSVSCLSLFISCPGRPHGDTERMPTTVKEKPIKNKFCHHSGNSSRKTLASNSQTQCVIVPIYRWDADYLALVPSSYESLQTSDHTLKKYT